MQPLAEDLHMAGAIHRLHRDDALRFAIIDGEHVLAEFFPVPRGFPERAVDELRRSHFDIPRGVEAPADVVLDRAVERPAFRMPEHRADGLFLLMEEIELAAEPAMIALLRLFELEEILLQLFLIRPGGAVDALQLRVARIAAPIGARDLRQLEGMA